LERMSDGNKGQCGPPAPRAEHCGRRRPLGALGMLVLSATLGCRSSWPPTDSSAIDGDPCTAICPRCTVLASVLKPPPIGAAHSPLGLSVNASSIFWVEDNSAVMEAPLTGAYAFKVASGMNVHPDGSVVADRSDVYWDDNYTNNIMRSPTDGGPPVTLAVSAGIIWDMALDRNNVYWTRLGGSGSDGAVMAIPKLGGTPMTLTRAPSPGHIAIDSANVYWADTHALMAVPLQGGTPTTLALGSPCGVAVDAQNIYWTDGPSVMESHLQGGAARQLNIEDGATVGPRCYLTVDSAHVFWMDDHNLWALPLTGGRSTRLASGMDRPAGLVLDSTSLYFTVSGQGCVMRLSLNGAF